LKVFLSVDMEGITDVVSERETDPEHGGEAYQANRHRMTREANAAIEGCLNAGAQEIVVADSHWNFDNLIPEELHEAATLLRGHPRSFSMLQDLDGSFAAALFVGFHAMAGTPRAIIDHTFTGRIRSVRVHDREVGETGINAFLAGFYEVPVVLVTGDSAVCAEARALLPWIHTAQVKEAVSAHAARHLHPKKASDLIRVEAEKALRNVDQASALQAETPVGIAVDFKSTDDADLASQVPGVTRVGGTRVELTGPDFRDAFRTFHAAISMSVD
jgi:D-amino peptidase